MLRAIAFVRLALVAASLAAIPLPAFAVEADISGSLSGPFSIGNGPGPDVVGNGQLPHLGQTRLSANLHYVEYLKWYVDYLPERVFVLSELQFTAANGDTLDALCGPTRYDPDTDELSWDVAFVGGTGRFEQAVGTATLVVRLPSDWVYYDGVNSYIPVEYELCDAILTY